MKRLLRASKTAPRARTLPARRSRAMLLVGAIALLSATGCGKVFWRPDFGGALRLAAKQNRVVILAYWSPLNRDCQRMAREVFNREDVQESLRNTIPVRADALLSSKLREAYGLRVVPSFIAIGPDGRVLRRATGYMNEARFRGFIEAAKLSK